MIKSLKIVLYSVLVLLVCISCNQNTSKNPESALSHPPYKSITDSITAAPKDGELYLVRALRLSQNGQHELATADYAKSWELAPNEATALQYVSNLMLVDEPAVAVKLLKECIEKYPSSIDFNRRLSEVYAQVGAYEEAMEQYDQLLSRDSANFETWFEKGTLLVQLKDTANAIKAFEKSYSLQPIGYNGLSLANMYASTLNPKALTLCDELIARDSAVLNEATFLKGAYYSDTKQYALALQQFEDCITRDWKFTDAYIEKGIVLFEQKQFNEALTVFKMASTVSNTNPDAYYWMGRCFEATGKRDDALLNYTRAVALDKQFKEAREAIRRLNG